MKALQNRVDELENLLIATDVTSNYLDPPLLSSYNSNDSSNMATNTIDRMCAKLNESDRDIMELVADLKVLEQRVFKNDLPPHYIEKKIVRRTNERSRAKIIVFVQKRSTLLSFL